jgi:hypothetical protein
MPETRIRCGTEMLSKRWAKCQDVSVAAPIAASAAAASHSR